MLWDNQVWAQKKYFIDIQEQPLSSALIALGYQTEISIIFDKSITEDKYSKPIKGSYTLTEAFIEILNNTGLKYNYINLQTVSILKCDKNELCSTDSFDQVAEIPQTINVIGSRPMDEIITIGHYVTGSRIRRTDINGSAPVDILTRNDIDISGAQSISGILKYLPSVAGNSTSTFVTNGGNGTASITLRGLPSTNTLVLINGKRIVSGGLSAKHVDLNSIPLAIIERIEVLKDGASAIYGSDAIAGVVNIIMRKKFEGFHSEVYYGGSSRNDLHTGTANITYGKQHGKGSLLFSINGFNQGEIFSRNRSISSSADNRLYGGIDRRSSAIPNAYINLGNQAVTLNDTTLDGSSPSHYRSVTDEDRYNYLSATTSFVPSRHNSVYLHSGIEISENLNHFLDTIYAKTSAVNTLAPVPLFTGFEDIDLTISQNNIYNPFGQDISDVRRRIVEMNPRITDYIANLRQLSTGFEYHSSNLDWDLGIYLSQNRSSNTYYNLLDATRVQRALSSSSNCRGLNIDGCIPLNLFGPSGSITQDQLNYIQTSSYVNGTNNLHTLSANLVTSLPFLPSSNIKLAAGLEYRKESIDAIPDDQIANGNTIGGLNFQPTSGDRKANEYYLELLLPLLKNKPYADSLELEIAARHSRYSDFGNTTNPKIGIKYYPTESLLIRASYGKGFRAPSLDELFSNNDQSYDHINDPCAQIENVNILPGCTQHADPSRIQFLTVTGGNESLLPEESKSKTVGIIWHSKKHSGLSTSLDFYHINQKNVVDSSAQFIVNQNAQNNSFSNRVIRDTNGNIVKIIATYLNIGRREILGTDLTINYELPESTYGKFNFTLNAAHIKRFLDQIDPSAESENLAGYFSDAAAEGNGALPNWKSNIGFSWSRQNWDFDYTIHYISPLKEILSSKDTERNISSWTIHDIQWSTFIPESYTTRVSIGIDNLFDKAPPRITSAFNDNIDARTYDLTGRFFYLRLSMDL